MPIYCRSSNGFNPHQHQQQYSPLTNCGINNYNCNNNPLNGNNHSKKSLILQQNDLNGSTNNCYYFMRQNSTTSSSSSSSSPVVSPLGSMKKHLHNNNNYSLESSPLSTASAVSMPQLIGNNYHHNNNNNNNTNTNNHHNNHHHSNLHNSKIKSSSASASASATATTVAIAPSTSSISLPSASISTTVSATMTSINSSSSSSTSLLMAIHRFKNSVKEMKETVLIPTRLNDLNNEEVNNEPETPTPTPTPPPVSANLNNSRKFNYYYNNLSSYDSHNNNGYLDEISEESVDYIDSSESNNEDNEDGENSSSSLSSSTCSSSTPSLHSNVSSSQPNTPNIVPQMVANGINDSVPNKSQHQRTKLIVYQQPNLFEQFKLLETIDKILSSDSMISVHQPMRSTNQFTIDGHDSNNNPRRRLILGRMDMENGSSKFSQHATKMMILDDDNFFEHSTQSNHHHHPNPYNGYGFGKHRHNNNSHKSMLTRQLSLGNVSNSSNGSCRSVSPDSGTSSLDQTLCDQQQQQDGEMIITDCSLLKIREKLEYHLFSLKSILSMMSDSAEHITRAYLEDIHSGDNRFDNSRRTGGGAGGKNAGNITNPSNDSTETRHYYTSN